MTRADGAQAARQIIERQSIHQARETYDRLAHDEGSLAEYWTGFWAEMAEAKHNDR